MIPESLLWNNSTRRNVNLGKVHRETAMSRSIRLLSIFLAIVGVVVLAPQCTTAPFDGTVKIRMSSCFASRWFTMRGTIDFADDDRAVKTISQGGYIRIEEGNWFRTERSYEVHADSSGSLSRTYRVGGRVRAMDADGQAWVAGAML